MELLVPSVQHVMADAAAAKAQSGSESGIDRIGAAAAVADSGKIRVGGAFRLPLSDKDC